MQVKEQREAWVKEDINTSYSLWADVLKDLLFKELTKCKIDLQNKKVVLFGCLKGCLIKCLMERASYIHAVDFSPTMLKLSREMIFSAGVQHHRLSQIIRDFSTISDLSTDFVIATTLLENLPEAMAERVIEDARRLIMPKGYLIFILPLAGEHRTKVNYSTPAFDTVFWTKNEIEKLAEKYRYKVIQIDTISIFQKP